MFKKLGLIIAAGILATPVIAETYMDATWAQKACNGWNASSTLTDTC